MNDLIAALREVFGPDSKRLVAAYFDPDSRFAGATFDTLPENPPDQFVASDILAASLLDVSYLPRAVRSLLIEHANKYSALLRAVPSDVDLWDATDEDLSPAYELWREIRRLDGVGPTRASKLMARKRSRLVPVVDRVVRERLPLGEDSWLDLRAALQDPTVRSEIEALRPLGLTEVSTLRILDAALWMNLSNSVHVRRVREAQT